MDIIGLMLMFLFLLNPYSLVIYIGYLIVIYVVAFKIGSITKLIDSEALILILFSFIYTSFDFLGGGDSGIQILIIQAIFPFSFYIFGKYLISNKLSQKDIFFLLISFAVIYSASSVATVLKDILEGGFAQVNRDFSSVWDGREILATGMAGYLIYNVTFPSFIISKSRFLNVFGRLILLFFYFVTILCSFRLGSRTLITLTVFSLLFSIVYQIIILKPKDKFIFIIQLIVISLLLLNFVSIDLEADYFSTLGHRLTEGTTSASSAGGRTELWLNGFANMFEHPLGWQGEEYGHNLWIDTAKVSGLLSLFFLLVFTVKSITNTKKIVFSNNIDPSLRICLGLFTIVTLIFFFGEPILEGNIYLFFFFCFYQGIVKRIIEIET
ncbi:hypothetical protein [Flagellimonas ochracea]|uniref:hypothetical protein n=1 Tax=Flagellimonas ochracea TaxID=2696472 RepID=UPI001412FB7A|nr:hypothetical protein [Allomuricauda ochracea]